MKQGVTRLVKSGQEVVNSAQNFYDVCVEHLQISPTKDDKCQHDMITFHFQKQIGKRLKTDKLVDKKIAPNWQYRWKCTLFP